MTVSPAPPDAAAGHLSGAGVTLAPELVFVLLT